MKKTLAVAAMATVLTAFNLRAADDFTVQTTKNLHDDLALSHDVYTSGQSAQLWDAEHEWLRNPAVGVRFDMLHYEVGDIISLDSYRPVLVLKAQTYADINVGISYAHAFISEEITPFLGRYKWEADLDSFGGYVAKQFDFGGKLGVAYTYSHAEYGVEGSRTFEMDLRSFIGSAGFARSFGEKKLGHNLFVDASANFLYSDDADVWDFVGLMKVGTALCKDFAVFGVINVYNQLDYDSGRFFGVFPFSDYRPYADDTWGEAGGGFQARLGKGFSLTAEMTTPVLDDGRVTEEPFLVRADLTWRF